MTIVSEVERPADCAVAVLPEVEVILPLEGLIDHEAERAKQRKSLADFERQIGSLKAKLGNESYVLGHPRKWLHRLERSSPSSSRSARP